MAFDLRQRNEKENVKLTVFRPAAALLWI